MTVSATNKFQVELWNIVEYFRREFDLTYAEVIGVLEMIKLDIHDECPKEDEA